MFLMRPISMYDFGVMCSWRSRSCSIRFSIVAYSTVFSQSGRCTILTRKDPCPQNSEENTRSVAMQQANNDASRASYVPQPAQPAP